MYLSNLFGKKQMAIASLLSMLVVGGLADPSYGSAAEDSFIVAKTESSEGVIAQASEGVELSATVLEMMDKLIVPEQQGRKLAMLINDMLSKYGVSFAKIPEDIRGQYLDATQSVWDNAAADILVEASKMEARGSSLASIEIYMTSSFADALTRWAEACVRQMVDDGIVEKYKGEVSVLSSAVASASEDGFKSSLSPEFIEKYSNAYVSSSVMEQAQGLCNTDKLSMRLVVKIQDKLSALHVTFVDIPEEVREKLLNESQGVFEEAYMLLVINGSRMEAEGASKDELDKYINDGFEDAIDVWADKWVELLKEAGCLDGIKDRQN